MPDFNRSLAKVLGRDGSERPWRWNPAPVLNPDGSVLVPGVQLQANGVFILLTDTLIALLRETLTQAQKDEMLTWADTRTEAQCALWHVSVWAGESVAKFLRIPATVWDDPLTAPPLKVRQYFARLWA